MSNFTADAVFDAALSRVKTGVSRIAICAGQPATRASAVTALGAGGKMLAQTAASAGSFTGPADGDNGGRKLTVNALAGLEISATGGADHIALLTASTVDYVTTTASQQLYDGNALAVNEWAMTLRDPAAFDPSSIAGLLRWYDAEDLTGDADDPISAWVDKGSDEADASASGDTRPLLKKDGPNGLQYLAFDADYMGFTAFSGVKSIVEISAADDPTAGSGDQAKFGTNSTSNARFLGGDNADGSFVRARSTGGADSNADTGETINTAWNVWVWNQEADGLHVYLNGRQIAFIAVTGYAHDYSLLGARTTAPADYWRGGISNVLAYDHALSATQIADVTDYYRGLGWIPTLYVAANGDDSNTGRTSADPLLTPETIASASGQGHMYRGKALLNGGDIIRTAGWSPDASADGLTIDSYGTGLGILTHATDLGGLTWSDDGGGEYSATLASEPSNLWFWSDSGGLEEDDAVLLTRGTAGALAAGGWDWSSNTVTLRLPDDSDPTGQDIENPVAGTNAFTAVGGLADFTIGSLAAVFSGGTGVRLNGENGATVGTIVGNWNENDGLGLAGAGTTPVASVTAIGNLDEGISLHGEAEADIVTATLSNNRSSDGQIANQPGTRMTLAGGTIRSDGSAPLVGWAGGEGLEGGSLTISGVTLTALPGFSADHMVEIDSQGPGTTTTFRDVTFIDQTGGLTAVYELNQADATLVLTGTNTYPLGLTKVDEIAGTLDESGETEARDGVVLGETFTEIGYNLTFSRASSPQGGYYFNASGVLVQAATNEPRFDHDPNTLALRGIMREVARTNRALYARDLTNAAWTKTNTTAALDQTGLTGVANSASSLTADANNGTCLQAITSSSAARVYSVWVKRLVGTGTIEITLDNGSNWTDVTSEIDGSSFSVVEVADTVANPVVGFRLGTSGDSIAVDANQEESGVYRTSPILTTSAAAARAKEIIAINPTAWLTLPGLLIWTGAVHDATPAATQYLFDIHDGTAFNRLLSLITNTGSSFMTVQSGGVQSANLGFSAGPISDGVEFTARYQVRADDFAFQYDDETPVTDNSGVLPIGLNDMEIGQNNAGGSEASLWFKSLTYTPAGNIQLSASSVRTEGDSLMSGAYDVSLQETLAALIAPEKLYNSAVGGATMTQVRDRVLYSANDFLLPLVTVFWDGAQNGITTVSAYADLLEEAIDALGHSRFVVIPPINPFGVTYAGSVQEAVAAEFESRWPDNFLHWNGSLANTDNAIDSDQFYDSGSDVYHLSQDGADNIAAGIKAFLEGKGWI